MKIGYLRVTHPCATLLTAEAAFAFDLHVLSTPPAFVLSQDQTLQLHIPAKITSNQTRVQSLKNQFGPLFLSSSQRSIPARTTSRFSRPATFLSSKKNPTRQLLFSAAPKKRTGQRPALNSKQRSAYVLDTKNHVKKIPKRS